MKPIASSWRFLAGGLILPSAVLLAYSGPSFMASLSILSAMILAGAVTRKAPTRRDLDRFRRRPYRPRDTGAGRWLEAPVAELDKSTVGKLLASRLGREPRLNVVVRGAPPPPCSDALYDAELDGVDRVDA